MRLEDTHQQKAITIEGGGNEEVDIFIEDDNFNTTLNYTMDHVEAYLFANKILSLIDRG